MKILILAEALNEDSTPDQIDVLDQIEVVKEVLEELEARVDVYFISPPIENLRKVLTVQKPDVVFNLFEALNDGEATICQVPKILDESKIPYTGFGTKAMILTTDKIETKKCLIKANIPTPEYYTIAELKKPRAIIEPGEYIIKPISEDASIGILSVSVVTAATREALLKSCMEQQRATQCSLFAERYIDGREFNVSMLQQGDDVVVFPPAEIQFIHWGNGQKKFLDYDAKWTPESNVYRNSVRSFEHKPEDKYLVDQLRDLSKQCWQTVHASGYARVDFRVDDQNNPYVLEINANPCLSPDAGFVVAGKKAGYTVEDLIKKIFLHAKIHKSSNTYV